MSAANFRRSEVNSLIISALHAFERQGFVLPPFAFWTPKEWAQAGPEWNPAREAKLGWDITDFGLEKFHKVGRVLFTLRNGRTGEDKPYAEKIILGRHEQRAPAHYHRAKVEDIINRGGGEVVLRLQPSTQSATPLKIYRDGKECLLESEAIFRLAPGESLCIPPGIIHQFWGEETEKGKIPLIGEVSSFCDDVGDNVFFQDVARYMRVVEDEPARFCLCHELPTALLQDNFAAKSFDEMIF